MNKRLTLTLLFAVVTFASAQVMAGTEYYTDENGFTQQRWVDDDSSSSSSAYESEGSKSYLQHSLETIKEAYDHMNDQGKARQIQNDLEQYR